jgi:elongation of very long chain fatty acids protein 4
MNIQIIFALRKKSNQITFLHVFHHFSMVANAWAGVKYVAGGQSNYISFTFAKNNYYY